MKSYLAAVRQIVEGAAMVLGYRGGTEEPAHSTEKLTRDVEIRRYDARLSAETTVAADERSARNIGFRRLAGYIFGGNQGGEKIAMTAPVSQESAGESKWVIRFFMPADKTSETLPQPRDAEVNLVNVAAETVAVHRFSGIPTAGAIATHTETLLNTLKEFGFEPTAAPVAWFYDPPWTVPVLRRNEIAVQVAAGS